MITASVVGVTGYAGAEILRLLVGHPSYASGELTLGALAAGSSAGTLLGEHLPQLPQLADKVVQETTPEVLAGSDVVFLALPHGHSARIAQQLGDDVIVIDCAADFRLRNKADWDAFYGGDYAGSAPYGIPEMPGHREELQGARRIAVPGCFPTGATLAALPAVAGGLIVPELAVVSITGTSGGGKKAAVGLLGAETMGNLKAYNTAGKHRHNPEIVQNLSEYTDEPVTVSFTPVLAPLPRGILTTITAPITPGLASLPAEEVTRVARAAYASFYGEEPFIHLLPEGVQPQTQAVQGANTCHVQVEYDAAAGRLLMTSAIDNLTKGTAGAAVQCMNLALGWEETAGLPQVGLAP
ncbi:N-acetyl-gamma-glutamyl-phosphate reductase [Corynebacterium sp. 13CS0277]|uniref:N-acetyl-gamma-glutamyl-phosphate reductase n=1 Tax=Corynebacterium sp. 13CS0277 TaxID=2071994 RepID=UPI000D044A79|nr:N-acetyl-gamma-glutamyl-phosphate reductase [Corynebacterium sp. 13CS0277]PRQ11188.1 N-acetyl-gamma-glutamyl-phosphate reductase [Corynebacterium sp. 13CS0277]